ncbi:hypothetical protein Clacol_000208 [Clathrus columnatus]|uniref:Uncharacterized protein n=1 Tax=Clathrus columnatus TaxID=1419009 RepID=A0AAV5A0B5_9AGAM|nr:hypothetical protein Clacol_000208 [Clathrus columnatus]
MPGDRKNYPQEMMRSKRSKKDTSEREHKRSKTASLEIKIGDSIRRIRPFIKSFGSEAGRVKTALQVSIEHVGDIKTTGHFHALRWLNPSYVPLLSLLEALQTLPNLQVLHLSPSRRSGFIASTPVDPNSVITLRELKVLIIEVSPILNLINAPKLSYLDVRLDFNDEQESFANFGGFDFSRITHIYSEIGSDCPFIMGKHEMNEAENALRWLNSRLKISEWPFDETSYPNQFYFSFYDTVEEDESPEPSFFACLARATNIKEIILKAFVPEDDYPDTGSFFMALTGAMTVRKFTVLRGKDFQSLCGFIGNPTVCPNLERLAYSSFGEDSTWGHLHLCLKILLERRYAADCFKPLEIDIQGFQRLPPKALQRIENMGGRLIQKPNKIKNIGRKKRTKDRF